MLDFKTCKILKDLGFPQEPKIDISGIDGPFFGGFYYPVSTGEGETAPVFFTERDYEHYLHSASGPANEANQIELVKIPQFEELVKEVHLARLEHNYIDDGGSEKESKEWEAIEVSDDGPAKNGFGDFPTESLASLWFSINYEG